MEQFNKSKEVHSPGPSGRNTVECFPRQFDFFGVGVIAASLKNCTLKDIGFSPFVVGMKMSGDEMGLCVAGIEPAPVAADEESMVIEMANVLFGKFATLLADEASEAITLSSPEVLTQNERKYRHLITSFQKAAGAEAYFKRYEFKRKEGQNYTIRLAFIPSQHGQT